jgi:hypothetical protein
MIDTTRTSISLLEHERTYEDPNTWPAVDRQLLLSSPHLGPEVIDRLRAVGIYSLYDLRVIGVDRAVEMVCDALGSKVWRNRRRALIRAVSAYVDITNRI